ncbi:MAG: hypothetical protein WD063_02875 [Pirellulales bacterium]
MTYRRTKQGRFAQRNRGGPGRPAKPKPLPPLANPDALLLQQQLERDALESWCRLYDQLERGKFLQLVAYATRRGERIPEIILHRLRKDLEP